MERRLVEWGILVDGSVADPFTSLQAELNSTLFFRLHIIFNSDILLLCNHCFTRPGGIKPFPFFLHEEYIIS